MGLRVEGNFFVFIHRALYSCFVGVRAQAVTDQRLHG